MNSQPGCFHVQNRVRNNKIKKKYENFRRKSFNLCLFLLNDEHRRLSNANIKKTSYIFFFLYPHKVTFWKNFIRYQNKKPERIISSIMAALFLHVAVSSFLNFSCQIFFSSKHRKKGSQRSLFDEMIWTAICFILIRITAWNIWSTS